MKHISSKNNGDNSDDDSKQLPDLESWYHTYMTEESGELAEAVQDRNCFLPRPLQVSIASVAQGGLGFRV